MSHDPNLIFNSLSHPISHLRQQTHSIGTKLIEHKMLTQAIKAPMLSKTIIDRKTNVIKEALEIKEIITNLNKKIIHF